jgi:ribosomal-protein-alanine N-acetyltransferase
VTIGPVVLEVPDLAGGRIHLRPWAVRDAASLVEAWHDPAIQAGSVPPPERSLAAAERWIEGADERRRAGVAIDLVIASDDDRAIGEVGLSRLDPERRAAIAGWWIHEADRGAGAATEAVSLFTEWALGPGRLRAVMAEIAPDNAASIRVAERSGFRVIDDTRNQQESARGSAPRVWYVSFSTVK